MTDCVHGGTVTFNTEGKKICSICTEQEVQVHNVKVYQEYKKVLITWKDSVGITSDWEFWGDVTPLDIVEILSIGWIIEETPDYITIAQAITSKEVLGRFTVPKCSIISTQIMEVGHE